MTYIGVIIQESLEKPDILDDVKVTATKVETVIEAHKTPWVKQWTLHTVKVPDEQADEIADKISQNLDSQHPWYADYKNDSFHYIIFRNKYFKIDRREKEQYDQATRYGITLGIPDYQLNFSEFITK